MSDIDSMLLLYILYLFSFSRFIHATLLKREYTAIRASFSFALFTAKIWENATLIDDYRF